MSTVSPLTYDGVRAPDFPASFPWLNTAPLSLRALRGKVVLLDFWTYGCINCLHVLPDLKKLEQKYPQELVVISVHSAKFPAESETEAVRSAVLRNEIEHPVLVDQNQRVWSEYAVRAWPTLVLIDPTGRIAGQVAGEGHGTVIDATIAYLVAAAKQSGALNPGPLNLTLERAQIKPTSLSFPGKIIAAPNGQLFIADSGHNRIIHATSDGQIYGTYGSGIAGLQDGPWDTAQFHNPQGMVWKEEHLYVADTDNRSVRCIDLRTKEVSTLACGLGSPWDLTMAGDTIYIAMAGNHQIWTENLKTDDSSWYAGSGAEGRYDGNLADTAFAQPSGLAMLGEKLYVADSESSCIREIDLNAQSVVTVAGGDLFQFGDQDGYGDDVRLQHPLGLASLEGQLFIADTYNSKIKRLNPESGQVETVFQGNLNEPGGLALSEGALYVADTNNHAIKKIDLALQTATQIEFAGLQAPTVIARATKAEAPSIAMSQTHFLAPNSKGIFRFEAQLPGGFHLNREAPLKFSARVKGSGLELKTQQISGEEFALPLLIGLQVGSHGSGSLEIEAFISYCSEGKGGVCQVEIFKREIAFEVRNGGGKTLQVAHELTEPEA